MDDQRDGARPKATALQDGHVDGDELRKVGSWDQVYVTVRDHPASYYFR